MRVSQSQPLVFAAIIAIASAIGLADDPATQPSPTTHPSPQIVQWVNDLTSEQFSVRQSAQQSLEQQGDSIIPQLTQMLAGPLPDEARARIRAAIHNIEDQHRFGPSAITIHCQDAPLQGVLEDFAHQAGDIDLGLHRPEIRGYLQSHKISLNLQRADFWTALLAIEDASGLHARPDNNGELILDDQMGFALDQMGDFADARAAGPCLIIKQSINWGLQYRHGNNISNLNLQLMAMVEPKLFIVGGFQSNWLRECVDEKGHSLLAPDNGEGFFSGPRQLWISLPVNLRVVPGMGKKIARLKGELSFAIRVKHETIEVNDILSAKNVTKSAGGNTITISQFTSENGQYQLHLLSSGAPTAQPWAMFQGPASSLQILDDKDQPLQQISFTQNNNEFVLIYVANGPAIGPPKKLRWDVTTQTRQISVPFEIDDLEIPHSPDDGPQ